LTVCSALHACAALLALTGCETKGWIAVPTYLHYYFYDPSIGAAPAPELKVKRDGATLDLAFSGSENAVSVSTMSSRGDLGFIMGPRGDEKGYSGLLPLDAVSGRSIPMRLWVAASCPDQSWVLLPSRVRLVKPTGNPDGIALTEGKALHFPDVELSLAGGEIQKSSKKLSLIELLFRSFPYP
jgi:hypothetical protein